MAALIDESAKEIEALVSAPGPKVLQPPPDVAALRAVCRRIEDLGLDLSARMAEGVQDYEVRKLLEFTTQLRRAIDTVDLGEAPDKITLAAMRIEDVLRRLERRLEHTRWESPTDAFQLVVTVLEGVPAGDVASILGVSTKTLGTWKQGGAIRTKADRVVLVAQLLSYLQPSLTKRGLVLWFQTKHDALGARPLDLLKADVKEAWRPLVSLARGGRDQLAS